MIECGTQATGGNYSFFTEVPGMDRVGFPRAEVADDAAIAAALLAAAALRFSRRDAVV